MRNRTENQVILTFIRHGETQANVQRRYLGKTDEPLSECGKQRLLAYKEQNLYPAADHLFTSPMKRCVQTAGVLYPASEPVIIPEWEEMDFGRFEYKNYEELRNDEYYQRWIDSGGMMDFPDGESRAAFISRCESGFERMCRVLQQARTENAKGPVRAAAIVHGGTIMALLSSYTKGRCRKGYFDYQTANGRGYLTFASWSRKEAESEAQIWIEEMKEL